MKYASYDEYLIEKEELIVFFRKELLKTLALYIFSAILSMGIWIALYRYSKPFVGGDPRYLAFAFLSCGFFMIFFWEACKTLSKITKIKDKLTDDLSIFTGRKVQERLRFIEDTLNSD